MFAVGFSLLVLPATWAQVCDDVYPHLSAGLKTETEELCVSSGCCWDSSAGSCFMPKINGYSYKEVHSDDSSFGGDLKLKGPSGAFGPDFEDLSVEFVQETSNRIHMKISPKDTKRWEVPESVLPRPGGSSKTKDSVMSTHIVPDPFQFAIRREKSTQDLFYMSKMLVFQDQYIQFVLGTPKNTVATFGFGESTRASQQVEMDKTYSMWATDYASGGGYDHSLYGSHPFFIQVLDDGTAHGALILNSNAMEASSHRDPTGVQGDTIGIQITGGLIDIYFFSGNSPSEVIQYYQEVIGKPMLTPYWSLGFHNCKWGYENIAEVEAVVANYSAADIPLEAQWVDIDYMDKYLDFTVDPVNFPAKEMVSFVDGLKAKDMHFVPIVDPGIFAEVDESSPYDALMQGLAQNVFIKDTTNEKPFLGQVWPGNTYFPDWFATNATSYWHEQLVNFHDLVGYDGIWIDMNEVANFCNGDGMAQSCVIDYDADCGGSDALRARTISVRGKSKGKLGDDSGDCCGITCSVVDPNSKYDNAPYVPHVAQGSLGTKTLPVSAIHENGVREYDAHSLYGLMESIATHEAVQAATGQRPFLLSRSTFPGSGVHTAHWTGDNAATWDNLGASIITMNTLSLFGMPMTGADICGFGDDTTSELCTRWIEVGAFSPFSRNHNSINQLPQELYRWDVVAEASRSVLALRYRLLPHLYTLMYRAASEGLTVMNGLWMHFPTDKDALSVEGQYMWSDSMLFTPVLQEGATNVWGYFPCGLWYSLVDDSVITGPTWVDLNTPLTATNVHVRGGVVLPMQQSAMTTAAVKKSPYTLIVAIDVNQAASGMLYQDDGVSVAEIRENPSVYRVMKFEYANQVFTSTAENHGYEDNNEPIEQIEFWGVSSTLSGVCTAELKLDDATYSMTASLDSSSGKLTVSVDAPVQISQDFKLTLSCA